MQLGIQSNNYFETRSQSELTVNYYDKSNNNSESLQNRYDIMMKNHSSNPIWLPASKHPQISPNEFELWIETHANESGPNIPNNKKNNVQRKKSVLSMVSFLLEEESSDEEEEIVTPLTPSKEDFPTLPELKQREYPVNMPEHKIRLRRQSAQIRSISQNSNTPIKVPEIEKNPNKKSSWFSNLFKKSNKKKKNSNDNTSTVTILNSTYPFEPKKTLKKKKEKLPPICRNKTNIIKRYPIDIEIAIYELSHVKLNNPKRPLQQQVVISNMMYWYLSITNNDNAYKATIEPPAPTIKRKEEQQRPTSPPLNHHIKSNKKKYKPVINTDYVLK